MKHSFATAAFAVAMALSSQANATPLASGASCTIGGTNTCGATANFTGNTFGTLVTSATRTVTGSNTLGTTFTGTLYAAVYQELNGFLTFYNQYLNDGPNEIHRITTTNFMGYTSDVGYRTDNFDGGGIFLASGMTPIGMDRNAGDIGYNFAGIPGGSRSNILVVKTNAISWTRGNTSIINGSTADVSTFAPVPEPGFYGLLSAGLAGLVLTLKRRNARKVS